MGRKTHELRGIGRRRPKTVKLEQYGVSLIETGQIRGGEKKGRHASVSPWLYLENWVMTQSYLFRIQNLTFHVATA